MKQWQVRLQKSRSYKWWVLAVIMVGTFMAVLDVTVVNVGLPTIMNVFHIGLSMAEWVVTAYMITMTIMLPTAGWLADRYGNKRIYVLGMILFTFGSWCCGRATVDEFLIFSRALQGVGSGIIQSLGLAIVSREFPAKQLSTALGLWAVAAAASISFGPLVGGFLVDDYSWHLIFDVNVPIGILGIAASLLIQKEWRNPDIGRFDWIGFVSVALFMPLVIYGLARGNASGNPHGWTAWDVAGSFAVAAVALAVFIVRELRTDHPLLDIRLLGDRHFGVSMLVLIIFGIGMFGGTYLLPLYMQNGLGYTALMAGMVFLPVRTPHSAIMAVVYLRGFGMGLTFAPLNAFSLRNLNQNQMAAAAGISNSVKQLAGSISIALLTAVMTSRIAYHTARDAGDRTEAYVSGVTDDFTIVVMLTLASALPFLLLLRRRHKGTDSGSGLF